HYPLAALLPTRPPENSIPLPVARSPILLPSLLRTEPTTPTPLITVQLTPTRSHTRPITKLRKTMTRPRPAHSQRTITRTLCTTDARPRTLERAINIHAPP